ncbi:MAG TPA: fumarylacetoacetate hydrolase family protein, partial [Actinomycetota bacterium]
MRLVTVAAPDGPRAGVVREDGIVALADLGHLTVLSLVESGPEEWPKVAAAAASARIGWALGDHPLMAPIPRPPRNAWAVGANYRTHFDEGVRPAGATLPEVPVFFTKPWTSFVGHDATVNIDRHATQTVDWEAEIAVVIGVEGTDVPADHAMEHVFGYLLANDVSARELQLAAPPFSQWDKGKSLDGFGPMGPWIV